MMNLRHLVTCRTNILWLIYTARRMNSNSLHINNTNSVLDLTLQNLPFQFM